MLQQILQQTQQRTKTQIMQSTAQRQRRSEKLTPSDWKAFKKLVDSYTTILDCSEAIGLSRFTVSNIYTRGTARTTTIQLIKTVIGITA